MIIFNKIFFCGNILTSSNYMPDGLTFINSITYERNGCFFGDKIMFEFEQLLINIVHFFSLIY